MVNFQPLPECGHVRPTGLLSGQGDQVRRAGRLGGLQGEEDPQPFPVGVPLPIPRPTHTEYSATTGLGSDQHKRCDATSVTHTRANCLCPASGDAYEAAAPNRVSTRSTVRTAGVSATPSRISA